MKKDMLIMSGKLRIIIPIIVLTILVLFAAFVWPTIYRYDRFHGTVVRINRFTGASEVLSGYGWHKMEEVISAPTAVTAPAPAPEKPMKPYLSQEEAQKLGLENKPVPVPPEDLPDNLKQ